MSVFVFPATRGPIGVRGPAPEEERKPKVVSELEKKLSEGEKMLGWAKAQKKHWARFTSIAWCLDMLFFFFAVLIFHMAVWYEAIEGFMPPQLRQFFGAVFEAEGLTEEMKQWLLIILVLLALPIVFNIVLSAVWRITSVTVKDTANETKTGTNEKRDRDSLAQELYRLDKALIEIENLKPMNLRPFWPYGIVVCFFLIPMFIVSVAFCIEADNLFGGIVVGVILFALALGLQAVLRVIKETTSAVFFSNKKMKKEIEPFRTGLRKVLGDYEQQLREEETERREQERIAQQNLAEELYNRATRSRVVNENLMNQAAKKGNPKANLYLGRQMLIGVSPWTYTENEMAEICKKAGNYLAFPFNANIPDGVVLYAFCQLYDKVSRGESSWTALARKLRGISKAGLSKDCREQYDDILDRVVSKADWEADREAARARGPIIDYRDIARRMAANEAASYSGRSSDVDLDLDMVQSSMHAADPNFDWRDAGE